MTGGWDFRFCWWRRRHRRFMWSAPIVLDEATAVTILLVDGLAELCGVARLGRKFNISGRPSNVLIWRACEFLPRTGDVLEPRVISCIK